MQELYDDIMKNVNNATTKSTVNADNAYKMASKLGNNTSNIKSDVNKEFRSIV